MPFLFVFLCSFVGLMIGRFVAHTWLPSVEPEMNNIYPQKLFILGWNGAFIGFLLSLVYLVGSNL